MNEPSGEENRVERSDESFIQELRDLKPAAEFASPDETGLHHLLYESGYRHGRRSVGRPSLRAPWTSPLASALAAGIVAVALTLGISAAVKPQQESGRRVSLGAGPTESRQAITASVGSSATDRAVALGQQNLIDQKFPDLNEVNSATGNDASPRPLRPYSRLISRGNMPLPSSAGRMTAFDLSALESDPPSSWLSLEDDLTVPAPTVYAGTLEPIALEMQVTPR